MIRIFIFSFAGFFTTTSTTNAQSISTDRPDQTESALTVPIGGLQIESGLLINHIEINGRDERQILLPTTLFRYGITDVFELRVVNQLESKEYAGKIIKGISDLEIGTKIQLLNKEGGKTKIALLSHLMLATGSSELTNGQLRMVNKVLIAQDINDDIGIGLNLGYNSLGDAKTDFTYSLACGNRLNDKVGIYVEAYGSYVGLETLEANVDAGGTYLVNNNLQLDASFGTGLNYKMNYFSLGFSWLALKK